MSIFGKLFENKVDKFINDATDSELKDAYENERKKWLKSGGRDKTAKMVLLNKEIERRTALKWKNDPRRSKNPNFRWTDANRWDKD